MPDNVSAITLRNICKSFGGERVLSDVSLDVQRGSLMAVCGPSGCGKSTLLNVVGLLERPDSGDVTLLGETAPQAGTGKSQRFVRDHISYLFQNYALVENETVHKNLLMALKNSRIDCSRQEALVERALERVSLNGVLDKKVCCLSGGQQQRVALARCMIKPGEIVLADEPTGSVDPRNRDLIVQIMRRMSETGKTVLVVTHDPLVAKRCDAVMEL